MSGKKKSFPPARTRRVNLRITEDLYNVLQTEATASDLSLSDYVRKILTSRHPTIKRTTKVVYNDPKLLRIFRDLRGCGTNLNQIAAYLNGGGTMTNQMWKEIKDCISEIYEMRDAVKEMAGEYRGYH